MYSRLINCDRPELQAQQYLNIGDTLKSLEYYSLATSSYLTARDLAIVAKDTNIEARICVNLVAAYFKMNNLKKSIEFANEHIRLTFIEKDISGRLVSYQNLIRFYLIEQDYERSLLCAIDVLHLAKAVDNKEIESNTKKQINMLHHLLNKPILTEKGLHALTDGKESADTINGYKEYMISKHFCNGKRNELNWPWFLGGSWINGKKHRVEEFRQTWIENKDRALELYLSGNHQEALKFWKQNFDIVKLYFKNSSEEAITCENITKILYGKQRYNEYLPLLKRMLELSVYLDLPDLEKDAVCQLQIVYRRKSDELKKVIFNTTTISLNTKKCLKTEIKNFLMISREYADISRTLDTIRKSKEVYLEELLLLAHTKLGKIYYSLDKYINSKYHYEKALILSRTLKQDNNIGLLIAEGLHNIHRAQNCKQEIPEVQHNHPKIGKTRSNGDTRISGNAISTHKTSGTEYKIRKDLESTNERKFSDAVSNFRQLQQQLEEHEDLIAGERYVSTELRRHYMDDVEQLLIEDEDMF